MVRVYLLGGKFLLPQFDDPNNHSRLLWSHNLFNESFDLINIDSLLNYQWVRGDCFKLVWNKTVLNPLLLLA